MSETMQIIVAICLLIAVYMLTRKISAWRMKRAYLSIIEDFKRNEALDESSAITIPYARDSIFRVGVRDFRPKALQLLVASGIVGVTEAGKYYMKNKDVGVLKSEESR